MEPKQNDLRDWEEPFREDAEKKRDDRHYYRNLILRSVSTFCIGSILMAFFQAFGLGGLLVGLALCGFCVLYMRCL